MCLADTAPHYIFFSSYIYTVACIEEEDSGKAAQTRVQTVM